MKAKVFLPLLLLTLGTALNAGVAIPTVAKTQPSPAKATTAVSTTVTAPTSSGSANSGSVPLLSSAGSAKAPTATTKSAQDAIAKNPKVNPFAAFDVIDQDGAKKPTVQPPSNLNKLTQDAIKAGQITPPKGNAQLPPAFASNVKK